MKLNNLTKRLITVVTWPVLIYFIVNVWNGYNNLAFSIFMCLASIIGSYEMQLIIYPHSKRKDKNSPNYETPLIPFWLPSVLIIAAYLENTFFKDIQLVQITLMSLIVLAFFVEVIKGAEETEPFSKSISRIGQTVLLIIYPAYICTFPIMLVNISNKGPLYILMLFTLVFGNDIACYVFGMLLGKSSRGVFKVSPNKSVVGYLGGFVVTPLLSYYFVELVPGMPDFSSVGSVILGVLVALTSDIGDLVESAFKRAGGVKDSGFIILGRGGVLDSFDSFLNSAPIFCLWIMQWSWALGTINA